MCDIAPFCMTCEWEYVQDKLIMCNSNRLHAALREIQCSLPIVGSLFEPYRCQGFTVPMESEKGEKNEENI